MFPEPTELFLIGCSIELIWTPKSKSNTSTPKTQLADILTKGNFTRDEWNHLLCLFNISHSFQFYSLDRCNGKTSSTRIRRRTCHSKIKTSDEFNCEDAFGRVVFVVVDDRSGIYLRDRHHQVIQKRIMVNLGLLKSGKVELRRTIDQGNLIFLLGI